MRSKFDRKVDIIKGGAAVNMYYSTKKRVKVKHVYLQCCNNSIDSYY